MRHFRTILACEGGLSQKAVALQSEIIARQIRLLDRRSDASDTTAENPKVPF
jgi:hypothetical protein